MAEVHGNKAAACAMEKYVSLIEKSLVSRTCLMQRVGDQIMILAESADDLAKSATKLHENSIREPNFLPVHVALHYGPVTALYGNYYGIPLNIATKMAAGAGKGTILSSLDFIAALKHPASFQFTPAGSRYFKAVEKDIEVFELLTEVRTLSLTPVSAEPNSEPQAAAKNVFTGKTCLEVFRGFHERLVLN